ncbi:hypothetical protein QJS66_14675 [Kocuria rhizophila]|nr:hypothetical protein QJS66_14675 [Kocuria rhizophila]
MRVNPTQGPALHRHRGRRVRRGGRREARGGPPTARCALPALGPENTVSIEPACPRKKGAGRPRAAAMNRPPTVPAGKEGPAPALAGGG